MSLVINNNYGIIHHIENSQVQIGPRGEILQQCQEPKAEPQEAATYTPPVPKENNYNEVRQYIIERKKYDPDFKYFCDTHNRKQLSNYLSKEFGWIVDDNSLGKSINRHL